MPNIQEESEGSQQEDHHESNPEVSFHPHHHLQPSISQVGHPQPMAGMYMPYIKGPYMDWMVNDGLYHQFLKWCLKCKYILECELAALPEWQQCKKVIAWSRYCGMDWYCHGTYHHKSSP